MARAYRVVLTPNPDCPAKAACRVFAVATPPGFAGQADPWTRPEEPMHSVVGRSWGVLLALVNLERRIAAVPPHATTWAWGGVTVAEPDWPAWKALAEAVGASYLLASSNGHPLAWVPARDGEWYGFLLNFGLIPGRWHWWVPGMGRAEREDGGSVCMILGEHHDEAPAGRTIRELVASLPPGLFDEDPEDRLSLREVLETVVRLHSQEEVDRCRFLVYRSTEPAHDFFFEHLPLALWSLEATRRELVEWAWTWLGVHTTFIDPHLRVLDGRFWGRPRELGLLGDFDVDPFYETVPGPEPTRNAPTRVLNFPRLAQELDRKHWPTMEPKERFSRTCLLLGDNPLRPWLERGRWVPAAHVAPEGRTARGRLKAAQGTGWEKVRDRCFQEAERQREQRARRYLVRRAFRHEFVTSDLFAVFAQQLMWAVEHNLTLRACRHPGCGRAFIPQLETKFYRGAFCPEHRGTRARKQRERAKRSAEKSAG